MSIGTQTRTYTVTDVRRVLASFAADFAMIAQATGLRSRDNVAAIVADLQAFAEAGYLLAGHLILWDGAGNKLRAARYTVSTAASGWFNQQPGNNLWPRTPGGSLQVIGTFSDDWWAMDEAAKARVRAAWGIASAWARTDTDTSHRGMTADADRRYVSSGYGLERVTYR
jgi:hypothetical protein